MIFVFTSGTNELVDNSKLSVNVLILVIPISPAPLTLPPASHMPVGKYTNLNSRLKIRIYSIHWKAYFPHQLRNISYLFFQKSAFCNLAFLCLCLLLPLFLFFPAVMFPFQVMVVSVGMLHIFPIIS